MQTSNFRCCFQTLLRRNKAAIPLGVAVFKVEFELKIRMADASDVAAMRALYAPYVRETAITFEYEVPSEAEFSARFAAISARCPWLVCEEAGEILGYAYADRAFTRAAYAWDVDFSVYLAMEARGRGIGSVLYTLLERMVAMQGYQVIYGLVTSDNAPSCRFHERMGYRSAAYFPNNGFKHGKWHGVTWYEKRLCPPTVPAAAPIANGHMSWNDLQVSDFAPEYEICISEMGAKR